MAKNLQIRQKYFAETPRIIAANFPELSQVSFILAQKVHASCVKQIITKLRFQSTSQPSFRRGKVTRSAQLLPEGTAVHDCPAGYVGIPN